MLEFSSGTITTIASDGTLTLAGAAVVVADTGDTSSSSALTGLTSNAGHLIGRRSYTGRFASRNRDILPVCFRAGSLCAGVPRRDLWVSPKHAMLLDCVLIPAAALVNGVSIEQAERIDRMEYVHVELDSHDVILAEGAASESYVDDDSRGLFHNAAEYAALYPQTRHEPARYCTARLEAGDRVQAVLGRLARR